MELLDRITVEPGKCGGRPCIRGLRVRVSDVLDMLAGGRRRTRSSLIFLTWNVTT